MREDVPRADLQSVLLDGGTGFDPDRDGQRRRVSVRGREVSEAITQLNLRIAERGDGEVAALLGEGEGDEESDDADE